MTTSPTALVAAGPHLDAVAAALARYGVGCRITRPGRPLLSWSRGHRQGRAAPPSPSTLTRGPAMTCAWTAPACGLRRPAPPRGHRGRHRRRPDRHRPDLAPPPLPAADATRLTAFLDGHPGWSAFWDKRYGLWRAAEDDPGSVLYTETPDAAAVISYITASSSTQPAGPAEDRAPASARPR